MIRIAMASAFQFRMAYFLKYLKYHIHHNIRQLYDTWTYDLKYILYTHDDIPGGIREGQSNSRICNTNSQFTAHIHTSLAVLLFF